MKKRFVLKESKCLALAKPNLAIEWHPTKNMELTPYDVSCGSNKKVWWLGKCGHEWQTTPHHRSNGTGCPICSGKQVLRGFNDFGTKFPDVLKDWDYSKNINLSPFNIYQNSNCKVWWKCHICGHEWRTSIGNRTRGRGCPCCSGKCVSKGRNDFLTRFPALASEWDFDKNEIKPDEITPGSNKIVWWKCFNGHDSYQATIYQKRNGAGCPICNTMFQTSFPEQTVFFYVTKAFPNAISRYKNAFNSRMELDIYVPTINVAIEYDGVAWHNNEKARVREQNKYLLCKKNKVFLYRIKEENDNLEYADKTFTIPRFKYDKPEYLNNAIKSLLKDIDYKISVDVDIGRDVFEILEYRIIKKEESLAFLYPDISKEWHPTLNQTLKPENVLPGTSLKVWWICSNGHKWFGSIINRTKGHGCDICAREQRKITYHNVRLKTRKLLVGCKCLEDWDYIKNEHTPDYYTKGSGDRVWWKCHKCGHEWKAAICDRTRDYRNGCPACSNRMLIRGKNDLATTNPELIEEWDYILNEGKKPSDVSQWSHTKVWWKCKKCGYEYKATPSNKVLGKGCGCCAGRVVVPGINDLFTTRPDIALDWHPTKNGSLKPSNVTKGRRDMIWWKCHICGHEWEDTLNHRNMGRGCSCCNKKNKNGSKKYKD